jgi:hypothetical protein
LLYQSAAVKFKQLFCGDLLLAQRLSLSGLTYRKNN